VTLRFPALLGRLGVATPVIRQPGPQARPRAFAGGAARL
jgi:hypothetical protein